MSRNMGVNWDLLIVIDPRRNKDQLVNTVFHSLSVFSSLQQTGPEFASSSASIHLSTFPSRWKDNCRIIEHLYLRWRCVESVGDANIMSLQRLGNYRLQHRHLHHLQLQLHPWASCMELFCVFWGDTSKLTCVCSSLCQSCFHHYYTRCTA